MYVSFSIQNSFIGKTGYNCGPTPSPRPRLQINSQK